MIIAICNQKGGVGKTTLATNIAYQLGLRSEKPVLLVDADPQGNATTMMSIDVDSSTLTLNDVMSAIATGGSPEVTSHAVYPASEVWGNIEVLPADRLLASRENDVSLGREQRLASALSVIKHEYAHIVVDCPPSLGMLTTNALVAADRALVVSTARESSADGVAEMITTLATVRSCYNPKLSLSGIAINSYRNDRVDRRTWKNALSDTYEDLVLLDAIIPEREAIARAGSDHEPIRDIDSMKAFELIADKLISSTHKE